MALFNLIFVYKVQVFIIYLKFTLLDWPFTSCTLPNLDLFN